MSAGFKVAHKGIEILALTRQETMRCTRLLFIQKPSGAMHRIRRYLRRDPDFSSTKGGEYVGLKPEFDPLNIDLALRRFRAAQNFVHAKRPQRLISRFIIHINRIEFEK